MRSLVLPMRIFVVSVLLLSFTAAQPLYGQSPPTISKKDASEAKRHRGDSLRLLDEIKGVLKEHYYDAKYRGMDLDTRFEAARERIKTLDYNWQMYRVLVQVLMDLNDSHTRFNLPPRTDFFDYGFSMQMIGDECFVVSVKKSSDAEKKGITVGAKVLNIGKFAPSRDNLWKIVYVLYRLDPSKAVQLQIETVEGEKKSLIVEAKTMTQKERRQEIKAKKSKEKYTPYECREINASTMACRLKTFVTERSQIDKMMKEVAGHSKLILDLRGNGGGYVFTEEHLVSYFFPREVKIADVVTRKKTESRVSKKRQERVFNGELTVLVDSRSGSAAEIFAKVIQIEKRGKVMGDVTAGAVMTSIYVPLFSPASAFADIIISSVGMSVTVGDVIMRDGSRLENVGVIPDVPIAPTGLALAKRVDAVLAYAATDFGAELSPEKAGEFHFITEKDDDEDLEEDPVDN